MTCFVSRSGGVTFSLCRTPMEETHREPAGVKWCFKCRKHLPHDFIVLSTVEPSYYEPTARYDCSNCHTDNTVGFGGYREWGAL